MVKGLAYSIKLWMHMGHLESNCKFSFSLRYISGNNSCKIFSVCDSLHTIVCASCLCKQLSVKLLTLLTTKPHFGVKQNNITPWQGFVVKTKYEVIVSSNKHHKIMR